MVCFTIGPKTTPYAMISRFETVCPKLQLWFQKILLLYHILSSPDFCKFCFQNSSPVLVKRRIHTDYCCLVIIISLQFQQSNLQWSEPNGCQNHLIGASLPLTRSKNSWVKLYSWRGVKTLHPTNKNSWVKLYPCPGVKAVKKSVPDFCEYTRHPLQWKLVFFLTKRFPKKILFVEFWMLNAEQKRRAGHRNRQN